jgi:hypothetical protein
VLDLTTIKLYYPYMIKTNTHTKKEKQMSNTLKTKTNIRCNTCGCLLRRTKSIKVKAQEKEAAIKEANEKIEDWQKSLIGQNCKICESILNAI